MKEFNTTQLDPNVTFTKHVYHRDQFAHYLRWTHVLKNAKIGMNVLDFGSGSGNLCRVFYRNKFKCAEYLGLEYRQSAVNTANIEFSAVPWAKFKQADLTQPDSIFSTKNNMPWDIIACFEVIEHVGKHNVPQFLKNIKDNMSPNTTLYLSTPVYDPSVGAAGNHIINGVIGELTFNELKQHLIDAGFKINNTYGTFASIKDYAHLCNDWQRKMFNTLREYYDTNLLSVIMAPMFPEQSRNCMWVCSL